MGAGPNPERTEKEAAKLIDHILKTRGNAFLELGTSVYASLCT